MINNTFEKEIHFGFYASRIFKEIERHIDNAISGYNITGKQARLLFYIDKKLKSGDVYQRDIEDVFCIRRSSVTSILQNLEKGGLITRTTDENDARLKKINLTKTGKKVLDLVAIEKDIIEKKIKSLISEEELKRLVKFADDILEALKD